jgi:ATP-dependent Clp protease ATP-binding subunit ClpC
MELQFDLLAIVQQLEDTPEGNEQFLSELLFFPEFKTFGNDPDAIQRAQQKLAQTIIEQLPGDVIARRSIPVDAEQDTLELVIAPSTRGSAWQEPVTIELPVVTWHEGNSAKIAYVPTLGIEVVANQAKKLPEMLHSHVRFELKRRGLSRSLVHLAMLTRVSRMQLKRIRWEARIQPPAERIKKTPPKKQKVLAKVGSKIDAGGREQAYCRQEAVEQVARLLSGRHPTCVLIVGESGVGKTAVTLELARQRAKLGLGERPFWRTSGSRIVAGQTGFGMWQERCLQIIAEAKETQSILCFGNLHELMQVGQSVSNSDSIASFLRGAMVRSDLLVVAECTPGQLGAIEARDPRILDPFRRVILNEPPPEIGLEILQHINEEPLAKQPSLTDRALRRLDSLHRRYMTYSASPGRPAHFLRGLRAESTKAEPIDSTTVTAAFSKETGLPNLMLEATANFDEAEITSWFRSRVHAQDLAVNLVIDRLSIVKAQLSRPKQPLASFLFAGPTGVGKTELAKTLAEFLYGSKDRLLRLDMSEYGTPGAASRLVSSSFDQSEGLLTSQVRDQPFSVILFDEFEKAHASLFDLLLQVLGEGRLTDAAGRLADFSNSVIIMTSNLGADSYRRPALGFGSEDNGGVQPDAHAHFLNAVKETFRPEFFNRIDRVIPFAPLDQSAIRSIALREIEIASGRDGLGGRRIGLKLSQRAIDWIVANGYDPRYGARPLKRALEQKVLLPVAEFLNRSQRHGGQVSVDLNPAGDSIEISYEGEVSTSAKSQRLEFALEIDRASNIRRDYLRLKTSPLAAELDSEKRRIEKQKQSEWKRLLKKLKKHQPLPAHPYNALAENRLAAINQLLTRLDEEARAAARHEELGLIDYYSQSASAPPGLATDDEQKATPVSVNQFKATLLDFAAAVRSDNDRVTLTFFSEDTKWMFQLADDYRSLLKERGCRFKYGIFLRRDHPSDEDHFDKESGDLSALEIEADEFDERAKKRDRDVGAISIEIRGGHCGLLLADEDGLHERCPKEATRWRCLIETSAEPLTAMRIPAADLDRIILKNLPTRRLFDEVKPVWKDQILQELEFDTHRGIQFYSRPLLTQILEDTMFVRARAMLGR